MKIKKGYQVGLLSLLLFLLLSPLGGYGGHQYKLLCAFAAYTAFTYFILKGSLHLSPAHILLWIVLPILIIDLPIRLIYFKESLMSLPSELANYLGIITGFLIFRMRGSAKIALLVLMSGLMIWGCFFGYALWINYLNFKTLSGKVDRKVPGFRLYTHGDSIITDRDWKGSIVVLDFWFVGCGACVRKFPEVKEKIKKYAKFTQIRFYTVNEVFPGKTKGQADTLLNSLGFGDFPQLFDKDMAAKDKFQVTAYPTTIILVNGDRMVYFWDISNIDGTLDTLLKDNSYLMPSL